jgi:hypothetical protein
LEARAFRTAGPGLNPLPYPSQVKLTCAADGPHSCEADLDRHIAELLAAPEGWGPIGSDYLDNLLGRLVQMESVRVLPAGQAVALAPGTR